MTQRILMASCALLLAACSKHSSAHSTVAASSASRISQHAARPTSRTTLAPNRLLQVGDVAPNFSAIAHTGARITLSQYRGKPIVLYFYPKDKSPGCTIEADAFRDDWHKLRAMHAVVLGVSADDDVSHRAFASTENLPFLLVPDPTHRIAHLFGVPVKRGYEKRVTFIIDKTGKIAKVFPNVNPKQHVAQVLAALKALG